MKEKNTRFLFKIFNYIQRSLLKLNFYKQICTYVYKTIQTLITKKETGVALVPSDLPNTLAMSHRNRDINDPRLINSSQEIDDPNDPEYVPLDDAGGQIYSGFVLNPYLKV